MIVVQTVNVSSTNTGCLTLETSAVLYLNSVFVTNVTVLTGNVDTLISFDMECLPETVLYQEKKGFLIVLQDKQTPSFHSRRRFSVQDQVVLHEAQL